jgi:flagellar biosynthesis/type III secretory pathway protein FliH
MNTDEATLISLQEFLRRFRRAWAPPGPALTRVAPPVDVTARLREEIEPLLAAIAEMQERAAAIGAEAERESGEILDAASQQAEGELRNAEKKVASARAEAAKKEQESFDQEIRAALDAARDEVQRIEAQSKERLPQIVTEVMDCVFEGPEGTP